MSQSDIEDDASVVSERPGTRSAGYVINWWLLTVAVAAAIVGYGDATVRLQTVTRRTSTAPPATSSMNRMSRRRISL